MTDVTETSQSTNDVSRTLRVLELYAGIGGMHCAVNRCFTFPEGVAGDSYSFPFTSFEVVAAVDVNEVAANVYRHNFPSVSYLRKGVEGFTITELEALRFDMVTMSPPCQPFTRQGLRKDEEDARTKSFFHFLSLLASMAKRGTAPAYILVENVFGFETSATHATLIETLSKCGFRWQEFLLTPTQFGIPNSRLRYFLIGKRNKVDDLKLEEPKFCFPLVGDSTDSLIKEPPLQAAPFLNHKSGRDETCFKSPTPEPAQKRSKLDDDDDECKTATISEDVDCVSFFLEDLGKEEEEKFLLPDKVLKRFMVMDVTFANSKRSCCFTKAYGKECM